MNGTDLSGLDKAAELLALAFYGLMLIALAALLSGALGWGFVFLVLGSAAHVARAAFEEFADSRGARAERPRPASRPRPQRTPTRTRPSRPARDEFVVTAAGDRRAAARRA
ncbi:MAG TPA: hypothetical protein VGO36_08065 [Solirubrobacterales bacterium]|jgi:hypothetical protein|nr:hypothetical protein [Solirubrobacterales bacterium]